MPRTRRLRRTNSSTEIEVFIYPDGHMEAVHNDLLHEIFPMLEITRFSDVTFNFPLQRWEARARSGKLLCHAKTRIACLNKETKIAKKEIARRAATAATGTSHSSRSQSGGHYKTAGFPKHALRHVGARVPAGEKSVRRFRH